MIKIKMARSVATLLVVSSGTLLSANETTTLDEVQVVTTAGGYEQNIKDAAATISVITKEELEKKSYRDISDALKNVPGINVSGSGANKTISIRGMGSEYTLYLIDGKPVQGNDAFNPNGGVVGAPINFLPPLEAIERIEVIRGPASSLYGSDAMGGVINIITKKHMDKATASIKTEYIKADKSNKVNDTTSNTSVYVNAPLIEKTLSFQFDAGIMDTSESDFFKVKKNANGSESTTLSGDSEFERKNAGGRFVITPDENNTVNLGYSYTIQERTSTPGKSIPKELLNSMGIPVAQTESYSKSIKNKYFIDHQAKYDKFVIDSYVNYDKDKNPSRVNATTGNGIEFETTTLNSQGTYFFDTNSVTIGANYKKENLEDGATNGLPANINDIVKMERYQWALFAEDTWSVTDDLALTLSGRYDYNEQFGSNFSPKAYAVYSLTDNLNLKGGVTSGYKAPSLRQSAPDFAGVSMGGVMLGNPDLTPEKSMNYEAGLAYDNSDLGLAGSLMLFQTDFEDKLMRITNPKVCEANQPCTYKGTTYAPHQWGYTETKNVDEAESKGIELTTDYYILENLKYRHSYTYNKTEQKSGTDKGRPFTDTPKHMFNAGLDWDVTSKLLLWTQVNYNGKTTGSKSQGGGGSSYVERKAYTLLDLGGVYKYDDKLQFLAGVYNISNEINEDADNERDIDGRRYSVAMNLKF